MARNGLKLCGKKPWFMNVYHDCPNEKSEEMSVSLRSINVGFLAHLYNDVLGINGWVMGFKNHWDGSTWGLKCKWTGIRRGLFLPKSMDGSWFGMSFRTSHATLSTLLYDAVCMCSGFYVPQMQSGRSRAGGLVDNSLPIPSTSHFATFPDWKSFSPMHLIPKKIVTLCALCTT